MLENIYKLLYKIKENKVLNKLMNLSKIKENKVFDKLMNLSKSAPIDKKSTSKHNPENTESNEDFIGKPTIHEKQIMLEKLIIRQARRKIEHS